MKKMLLTITFLIGILSLLSAQEYKTGIGFRAGIYGGLTVKHFLNRNGAIEGILDTRPRWHGLEITGLYEIHGNAFDVDRFYWFVGGGGHIGSWADSPYDAHTVLGVDGILGLEYDIKEIPVSLGLDWKPAFNLFGTYDPAWDGLAFSARFIF